jgi:NHLM bacteriocin system ABC transporter ATP-binding protein
MTQPTGVAAQSSPEELKARQRIDSDRARTRRARAALRRVIERRPAPELRPDLPPLAAALVRAARVVRITVPEARLTALGRKPGDVEDLMSLASRLRIPVREVELSEEWWRERGVPLVVLNERTGPLALEARRGGYHVIEDQGETGRPIDEKLASTLGHRAWAVTPRFPDRAADWRDVLRIASALGASEGIATLVLTAIALLMLGLAVPLMTKFVITQLIPNAELGDLVGPAVALAAIAFATIVCSLVQGLAFLRFAGRADASIGSAVFDRIFRLPVAHFREVSTGDALRRALAFDELRDLVGSSVSASFSALGLATSSVVLIVVVAPGLGIVPALTVVALAALATTQLRRKARAQRAMLKERNRLTGLTMGMLRGISKLRVAGAEERLGARWLGAYARQLREQRASNEADAQINILTAIVAGAATLALVASALLAGSQPDPGDFVVLSAAIGQLAAAAAIIVPTLALLASVTPLYETARPLLEAVPEGSADAEDPGELEGAVELGSVVFRYVEGGPIALDGVSLRAEPGEFVAVVGPSGAGKSTVVRMLLGFERPESGSVLYDDRDLTSLDIEAVRRQIGAVIQGAELSTGSILQNIVGVLPFTEDDAWKAAERAGVADDIRRMPMQMQTVVVDGGATFSGGQRQRLIIARAMLRRPRVIIFDEATSALDNATQASVTASLEELGATRIVIAHRLSTIQRADRIYVLQAGRVVESGTYAELVDRGGAFTELAKRQRLD